MNPATRALLLKQSQLVRMLLAIRRLKQRRRFWQHPIFQSRPAEGEYATLLPHLRRHPEKFTAYFRMDMPAFDLLLGLIGARLEKTSIRAAISPEQRLAITLTFLASGTPYRRLAFSYRVAHNTISLIVREVCSAIVECLQENYMRMPSTPEEWMDVADGFWKRWNLPNTLGAIDGKHVQIKKPAKSGSAYFNYKGHFSMVLMAVCDSRYRVLYADYGNYGADGDGRIFAQSDFKRAMDNGTLNVPAEANLPGSERKLPFFFVGDNAFPKGPHLMNPFSGGGLSEDERIYNYRISRGRRVIENVFGIMAAKWRLLNKPIETNDETADLIIKAICALHNYVIDECGASSLADTGLGTDDNGSWRTNATPLQSAQVRHARANRVAQEALEVQAQLVEFFNNEGAVEWQRDYI